MKTHSAKVIEDVAAMLGSHNLEDAIRLSGEELARADNRWRRLHNEHAERGQIVESLSEMMTLASLHSACLRRADMAADAFNTNVAALTAAAFEDALMTDAVTALGLADSALADLQHIAERMPYDEHTRLHLPVIISYLASIQYALYRKAIALGATGSIVNSAYTTLQSLIHTDAVQPKLNVPDGDSNQTIEVDPTHPLPALLDLMSRAAALGLIEQ